MIASSTVKMEAVCLSEMVVTIYQATCFTSQKTIIFMYTNVRTSYLAIIGEIVRSMVETNQSQ
jgi:hypothetical protein